MSSLSFQSHLAVRFHSTRNQWRNNKISQEVGESLRLFLHSTLLICNYEGHHYEYDDGILTPTSLKCSKDMLTCQWSMIFPFYKGHTIDYPIIIRFRSSKLKGCWEDTALKSFISHYNNLQKIIMWKFSYRFKERLYI